MDHNKENITVITITREYDKICLLESYLKQDSGLESIVSNLIDSFIQQNQDLSQELLHNLKIKINNSKIFDRILQVVFSIVYQTPYVTTIAVNDKTNILIKYLEQPLPFIQNLF